MPVVYADVVWLVNLVMDTVLLATTGWIVKRPLRWKRLALGGLIGSIYALLLFIPPLSLLTTWPGKALVSLLMVWVAIPSKTWRELLRTGIVFYFVSFVFAGAAIAMHYAVPGTSVGAGSIVTGKHLAFVSSASSLALLVALPVGYGTLRYVMQRVKTLKTRAHSLYEVVVRLGDAEAAFTGLMDTGNHLRDPLSRKPVCFLEESLWLQLVPHSLGTCLEAEQDVMKALSHWDDHDAKVKLVVIPYRGAGQATALTLGVVPSFVGVRPVGTEEMRPATCVVALHRGQFSADRSFQGILHTEMITGDENFEEEAIASAARTEISDTAATSLDKS